MREGKKEGKGGWHARKEIGKENKIGKQEVKLLPTTIFR